jgi:hypothetical protein
MNRLVQNGYSAGRENDARPSLIMFPNANIGAFIRRDLAVHSLSTC